MMLIVFIGWTLTSFVCHFFAKRFIINVSSTFLYRREYTVIVLTVLQVFFYKQVASFSDEQSKDAMVHKLVIISFHACATLATNWSMALTYTASTFAIKLMEPLTSAVLQKIFLKVRLSFLQWISIPVVVSGAIVFAQENNTRTCEFSKGMVLAFISNVCLSLRNVYMKKKHLSNAAHTTPIILSMSGIVFVCTIGALILYYIADIHVVHAETFKIFSLLFGSSLFHAIYSYISTVIILRQYSVVAHAFGNIFKRLAVLGLLYMTGSRTASIYNFIGLSICVVGLAIYALSKVKGNNNNQSDKVSRTLLALMMKSKQLFFALVTITMILLPLYQIVGIHESLLTVKKYQATYANGENFSRKSFIPKTKLSLSKQVTFNITDFYSMDLTNNPEEADKLSPLLRKRSDVIDEAQRIHMNIFKTLLSGYRYAMLFDYSISENKGDSAITVGETILLRKINIEVVFACSTFCTNHHLDLAQNISKKYTRKDLVILLHGGGNIIGYAMSDYLRFVEINRFLQFNIVMFPQSILYVGPESHKACENIYATHPNLTFVWRDKVSFNLGKKLFPKVRSLLSPDIAYQIGHVPRFMTPTLDVIWMKRTDQESPVCKTPEAPRGIRMHVFDWLNWPTPLGTSPMEDAFLRTTNGLTFLQRGRVVVTDRLHGHILSTLLNIPHVYIDNGQRKISNYHNTWTAGLDNVVLANSSDDAVVQAKKLLVKLDKALPAIKGYYT